MQDGQPRSQGSPTILLENGVTGRTCPTLRQILAAILSAGLAPAYRGSRRLGAANHLPGMGKYRCMGASSHTEGRVGGKKQEDTDLDSNLLRLRLLQGFLHPFRRSMPLSVTL